MMTVVLAVNASLVQSAKANGLAMDSKRGLCEYPSNKDAIADE